MKISKNFSICRTASLSFWVGCFILCFGVLTAGAEGWHPGRLLVKPKAGCSLTAFHKTCAASIKTVLMAGDEPWEVVEFDPLKSVPEMAKTYLKSGLVQYAHPDYWVEAAAFPDDPHTQNPDRAYNIQLINAPAAWECATDASGVLIAVVDTGARYTHEDLKANIWTNPNEIPDNGIDDDRNGYVDDIHGINLIETDDPPTDDTGHGTHVTGIIAAQGNNSTGVCGIAWNAKVILCRFMSSNSGSIAGAVEGLIYARKRGARIINASWTVPQDVRILSSEINTLRSNGIIVVCASGNKSDDLASTPLYPALYSVQYPNVITVANSNSSDNRVYDSSYSKTHVQLFAPGRDIYSTYYSGDSRYSNLSGTSMSAPHVTGALALYLTLYPKANYLQVRNALLSSVDPCSQLADYCSTGGRLNVAKLLSSKTVPEIVWPTPEPLAYGEPLSATQLNASCQTEGSFTYSHEPGTTFEPGTYFLRTSFTPCNPTLFLANDKTVSLVVEKGIPDLSWTDPQPIVYGTLLSETQLNATASVEGTFYYQPASGTLLEAGTHTLKVSFLPQDTARYKSTELSVNLEVLKAEPVLSWSEPQSIVYGTLLSETQLNATASVPGTFLYEPAAGTLLEVGTHELSTTFTPEDSLNYNSASASVSLTVTKPIVVEPTLSWTLDGDFLVLHFTGVLYESSDLVNWNRIEAQESYRVELPSSGKRYYRTSSE